jgi:nucleoside-triphosphatase THEP1
VSASPRNAPLPDLWLKAAVAGSLWASIEIIAGSFLHNLRVPLAGSLLAATGAGLLTGAHQIWPERGLLWRAGLICALMKSISPTAVVLGPMIGILAESLLLEGATRVFGRTPLGYAIGGALAVSWTLAQKVASFLITFGGNIVALYVRLVEFAARSLRLPFLGPEEVLGALLAIDVVLGAAVALAAMRAGRRVARGQVALRAPAAREDSAWRGFKLDAAQKFSLPLLGADVAGVAAGLLLLERYPLWAAVLWVAAFSVWVGGRYRGALRRFRRARLWMELGALMLLSGLLLGAGRNGGRWTWGGLGEGLEMIVRAWLIIAGFAAVSIELRNPRLIEWFTRRRMRAFSDALSIAFEALPAFAGALGQQRQFTRRPLAALTELLGQADAWLRAYQRKVSPRVVLLAGGAGQGKTTVAAETAARLRESGLVVGGVLAHGFWRDGERWGFDVEDLLDGRRQPLCRRDAPPQEVSAGPFHFLPAGLEFGRAALSLERLRAAGAAVVIVDEVGPLELSASGWADSLEALVAGWPGPMLWVVRRGLVSEVASRWLPAPPAIVDLEATDAAALARRLME